MIRYIALYLIVMTILLAGQSASAQAGMEKIKVLLASESNDEALAAFYELIAEEAGNAELWFMGAIAQRRLMRQDSSLIFLQRAADIEPEDERILTALAHAYTEMRQFTRAEEIYGNLILMDSVNLAPHIQLAALHLRTSRPGVALDIYYYLHEREPDNYSFVKSIASCYIRTGNDLKAVSYYKMAHKMNPDDLSINTALSGLYLKMKNYREGLEIAERGLEVDRQSNELLYWSGLFNYTLGFHLQAINRLDLAEKNGNESFLVKQYLGICYFRRGELEKARDYLEAAIIFNVNNYQLYNYLGIIYKEMGDPEISEKYFINSLAVLAPPVDALTETYRHLIDLYKQAGEMKKAVETYRSALDYDKDNPYLHYGLAYTLDNNLDQNTQALDHYIRFSELAVKLIDTDRELPALIDYSNSRIKSIKEDIFFNR